MRSLSREDAPSYKRTASENQPDQQRNHEESDDPVYPSFMERFAGQVSLPGCVYQHAAEEQGDDAPSHYQQAAQYGHRMHSFPTIRSSERTLWRIKVNH